MDFYLGDRIDEIDFNDECVEFSDELISYISRNERKFDFDMTAFYSIDPYNCEELSAECIEKLIAICENLLKTDLFDQFDEYVQMIMSLKEIAGKAIETGCGLVSIGD